MRVTKTTLGIAATATAAAAVAVMVLSGDGGSGAKAAGPSEQAMAAGLPVPVVAVVKKSVPVYLDYVGTAEAIRTVTLQAKVTGYLASRGAADGADVKEGDLLYRIDPRDYQAALDQVKAQAQRDEASHDYSRVSQHRNAVLSKDGWVPQDTSDQTTSTLHQSDATLAADRAAIETAQLNLGYTEIRAPFAGRLSRSLVHEGALINATATQLNTLVQLDPIYATFNPSEKDLGPQVIDKYRASWRRPGRDPSSRTTGPPRQLQRHPDLHRQYRRSRHRDHHRPRDNRQPRPVAAPRSVCACPPSPHRPAGCAAGAASGARLEPAWEIRLRRRRGQPGGAALRVKLGADLPRAPSS